MVRSGAVSGWLALGSQLCTGAALFPETQKAPPQSLQCRFVWGRGAIDVKFGVTALLEAVSQHSWRAGVCPASVCISQLPHWCLAPPNMLPSSAYAVTVPACLISGLLEHALQKVHANK